MFVLVYLEESELEKFLAGDPCEGALLPGVQAHLTQVMVPKEKVTVFRKPVMLGLSTPMARIAGDLA